jgi:hypothetical protein
VVVCLLFASAFPTTLPAPFWAPAIDSALQARDLLFRTVLHADDSFPMIELDRQAKGECLVRLAALPDSGNPWNMLCRGLLGSDVAGVATTWFGRCLDSATNRPGELWVLFVEFSRNSQSEWADRALLRLEKLLLESNATGAPVICQQLMYYGVMRERHRDPATADRYFAWAQRFDPNQPWSILHRARLCLPGHPLIALQYLAGLPPLFLHSWSVQLSAFGHAYDWLRLVIMAWVLVAVAGLSLRHLPRAVHPMADRLPGSIPPSIRTLLIVAIVAATAAFGAIPFLWILAMLIVPFLEKREWPLFVVVLLILAASPLDSRISEVLLQARRPESPVSLYLRAAEEGYSDGIRRLAVEKTAENPRDALSLLALSNSLVKSGDAAGGRLAAMSALSLHADDPEALSCAALTAFGSGDYTTAAAYYRKIIEVRPGCFPARYNYVRCCADEADTVMNLDFIRSLPAPDQDAVNEFIARNDACFGTRWPVSRRLMDLFGSDLYFRTPYFREYGGSWQGAARLWGGSFFGLPPLTCLFLFPAFFAVLLLRRIRAGSRTGRKTVVGCTICNRPVCDGCRRGTLCHTCFHAISAENRKVPGVLETKIRSLHERRIASVASLLDIALPGCGMLFAPQVRWSVIVAVGCVTALVYGSCMYLMTLHLSYPLWVVYGEPERVVYWFPGYNLFFVGRMVIAAVRKRGTSVL